MPLIFIAPCSRQCVEKKGMRNGGAKLASLTGQTDPRNSAAGAKHRRRSSRLWLRRFVVCTASSTRGRDSPRIKHGGRGPPDRREHPAAEEGRPLRPGLRARCVRHRLHCGPQAPADALHCGGKLLCAPNFPAAPVAVPAPRAGLLPHARAPASRALHQATAKSAFRAAGARRTCCHLCADSWTSVRLPSCSTHPGVAGAS